MNFCVHGKEGLIVYDALQLEENHTVDDIVNYFDIHFIGKTSETYERYICSTRGTRKLMNLSKINYIAALRTLASTCNFCDCLKVSLLRGPHRLGNKGQFHKKTIATRG